MRYFSISYLLLENREGIPGIFRSIARGVVITDLDMLEEDVRHLVASTQKLSLLELNEYPEGEPPLEKIEWLETRLSSYAEERVVRLSVREHAVHALYADVDPDGEHYVRIIADILPEGTGSTSYCIVPSSK